jgi:phosphoribosylamine-glycine ligase
LAGWRDARWLGEHKPSRDETRALLKVIDRDLRDSAVAAISPDTQLGLAYNAALQAATIALAASGYRASRERKHHITIQSLTHTIGTDAAAVRKLDAFRKKRNERLIVFGVSVIGRAWLKPSSLFVAGPSPD